MFCPDGLTGVRLSSDELCAARREKPSTTLRCGDRLCQWQANKQQTPHTYLVNYSYSSYDNHQCVYYLLVSLTYNCTATHNTIT